MKTISAEMKAHIQGDTVTLAHCLKITRTDDQVFGFTNHDADIDYDSVTYNHQEGTTDTTVSADSAMSVDNLDVVCALAGVFTEDDMLAGIWDFAVCEFFMLNWEDVSMGELPLTAGKLGQVGIKDFQCTVEIRSETQALQQTVGRTYGAACDARFCDSRCGLTLATYTYPTSVISVTSNRIFTVAAAQADRYFNMGICNFTSGNNDGYSMEIKGYQSSDEELTLFLPMPNDVEVGDTVELIAGCDKTLATCRDAFDNVVNHRGFPYIPGRDKAVQHG